MRRRWRYPDWLFLRDPIVDHCKCCYTGIAGHLHCRSWTLSRALAVFAASGLHPL